MTGCASTPVARPPATRDFDFQKDTFAYANELDWEYRIDPATGTMHIHRYEPTPAFIHRCFAISHMARQFFQHARFEPALPRADEATYRQLIDRVLAHQPAGAVAEDPVVIPGYADLRAFSQAEETLLKEASGSSLHSYFQLSNWRMIFPFGRDAQEAEARRVLAEIREHHLPILHLIRFAPFPFADINHVVVVIAGTDAGKELQFSVYDPNNVQSPVPMTFDFASRSFIFPTTNYFADGPVNAYEIFEDDRD